MPSQLTTLSALTDMPYMARDVADYLLAATLLASAVLMLRVRMLVGRARPLNLSHDSSRFWLAMSLLLSGFALVKALNILALTGGWLRSLAQDEGLYDDRRTGQLAAFAVIGVTSVAGIIWVFRHRRLARRHRLLLVCAGLLAAFAAARFVSLHEVDGWMGHLPWIRAAGEWVTCLLVLAVTLQRHSSISRRLKQHAVPLIDGVGGH